LNFHSQNIGVNGKRHPVGNRLDFSLFLFNRPAHIADPLFHSGLHVFARLHFFSQLRLVLGNLAPHLFVVSLELLVEAGDLFLLCKRALEVAFDSGERPLELFVFLAQLFHIKFK
jgi:hypothetical protein